jgi:predicted aldo/keto reductase-like oxidoreductase
VNEWRLHNVATLDELDQCFRPGGAIEALLLAKDQGMARCLSISAHTHPQVLCEAVKRFRFDSVMFPASALDRFINSFEEGFLPLANAAGIATIAMKALALGKLGHVHDKALRYCLGLPVSMVIVGCSRLDELERDLQVAEGYTPLDEAEQQAFFQQVRPLVTPKNVPWKAVDWGKTGEWIKPE